MKGKVALIAGASGLVGNELLQILLRGEQYEKIYALVRRSLDMEHPKLVQIICDFDQLDKIENYFEVDDVYCCLETTIKIRTTSDKIKLPHKILSQRRVLMF